MNKVKLPLVTAALVVALVGCATIVEGTKQTVTVTTTPAGAVKTVNDKCQPDQEDQCAKAVEAIGTEKDAQLAELERKRLLVRITG